MEDFAQTLAFEVKKEIAERYFGFRKSIEEDSDDYQKEIISSTIVLEQKLALTCSAYMHSSRKIS